jgi:hypothetical protein
VTAGKGQGLLKTSWGGIGDGRDQRPFHFRRQPVLFRRQHSFRLSDGRWHILVNGVDMGPVLGYDTIIDLLSGVHTITAELHTPEHVSLGIADTVTVTVTTEEMVYQLYLPLIINADPETTNSGSAAITPRTNRLLPERQLSTTIRNAHALTQTILLCTIFITANRPVVSYRAVC